MITPIENAQDLSEQTDISYGTLEGGSTMTFFRVCVALIVILYWFRDRLLILIRIFKLHNFLHEPLFKLYSKT